MVVVGQQTESSFKKSNRVCVDLNQNSNLLWGINYKCISTYRFLTLSIIDTLEEGFRFLGEKPRRCPDAQAIYYARAQNPHVECRAKRAAVNDGGSLA